ncbi:hypothetical protein GGR51DRAFT_566043 [Nemania sp. FL0031]|nr:hypothetical protein GGR51DRAFT_566043 [Nemania sp. FL0031]
MTQSTTPEYIDFIPYDPEQDALNGNVPYDEVSIRGIPPSYEPEPDHEFNEELRRVYRTKWNAYRSEAGTERLKEKFIQELDSDNYEVNLSDIRMWQWRCSEQGFWFSDYNRLVRFFICRNKWDLFEKLPNVPEYDANRWDALGRSIVFYALWPFPSRAMFTTVTSEFWPGSMTRDLSYRDIKGQSLLHYAIKLRGMDALEYLLARFPDSGIDSSLYNESKQISRQRPRERLHRFAFIQLLLGFKMLLLNGLPESRIGFVDFRVNTEFPFEELEEWQLLSHGNSEIRTQNFCMFIKPISKIVLIYLKSLLRRCGQEGVLLTSAGNTPVIHVIGNPYIDPSYLSNLEAIVDPQQRLGRQVYITFPYLALRTKDYLTDSKESIRKWKERNTDYYTQSILLHPERTLDETYFPSLSFDSLEAREKSQVVSREFHEDAKPILVVPNLWIWRIGCSILTTYSSSAIRLDEVDNVLIDDGLKFHESEVPISRWPGVQIGLIIAHHISNLGNRQSRHDFPPTLDIFERSVVRILEEVDEYTNPKNPLGLEMEQEHEFMLGISDIREELVMIQEILKQQLEIFDSMVEDFEHNDPDIKELQDTSPGLQGKEADAEKQQVKVAWKKVKGTRRTIVKYQTRVRKIDADAERVEKRIQDQLNLKRTHFSIKDARTSLLLGTAVIGFTVITVIFAPLAFMTALFALPIDILVRNQFSEGETEPTATYSTRYVGTWFTVAEVASLIVTILLVWVCLWLLGGTESFIAMRGNRARKTDSKVPDVLMVRKVKGKLARGQRDLRDRARKAYHKAHDVLMVQGVKDKLARGWRDLGDRAANVTNLSIFVAQGQ